MQKTGRLELTWVGKYEEPVVEPRILLEDKDKSYGDASSENMFIHGDNLIALQALQQDFSGKIKCIYIDPPYNTGSAFEYYDDNLEHSIWLSMMKKRLVLLRELLAEDGTIWIQIDDEEQAYLKVLCDEIFGRGNFINMISVNMKNIAGVSGGGEDKRLKKNCEYILAYAKEYSLLPLFNGPYSYTEMSELVQQYLEEGKSWKYTTVLLNPGEKVYYSLKYEHSSRLGIGTTSPRSSILFPFSQAVSDIMQQEWQAAPFEFFPAGRLLMHSGSFVQTSASWNASLIRFVISSMMVS